MVDQNSISEAFSILEITPDEHWKDNSRLVISLALTKQGDLDKTMGLLQDIESLEVRSIAFERVSTKLWHQRNFEGALSVFSKIIYRDDKVIALQKITSDLSTDAPMQDIFEFFFTHFINSNNIPGATSTVEQLKKAINTTKEAKDFVEKFFFHAKDIQYSIFTRIGLGSHYESSSYAERQELLKSKYGNLISDPAKYNENETVNICIALFAYNMIQEADALLRKIHTPKKPLLCIQRINHTAYSKFL